MFYRNGKVTIHFDHLLEWNGIINKIDANILFAMKSALEGRNILSDDSHKVSHDNARLNSILSKGISDNHMHLKGSGYTSDMNWYDFSTEIHGDYLQAKSKIFFEILKTFDMDYEQEELAFLKIKVVKYYLFGKYLVHYDESEKYQEFKKNVRLLLHTVNKEELELIQSRIDDDLSSLSSCWEEKYRFISGNPKYPFLVERMFLKELFSAYLSGKMSHFDLYLLNCYLLDLRNSLVKIMLEWVLRSSNVAKILRKIFSFAMTILESWIQSLINITPKRMLRKLNLGLHQRKI